MQKEILDYYRQPAEITNLEKYSGFLDWLTCDPRAISQVVQGLLIHDMWIEGYGAKHKKAQEYQQKTAYMEDLLDKAMELNSCSLAIPRAPEKRVICCCREFTTLMCAILRHKGIPARSRCGFASYFDESEINYDHWACEYWSQENKRWVMADPQIDPLQQSTCNMKCNPLDLKCDEFLVAGKAWQLCRTEQYDPQKFGLENTFGLWFVRGNLLRDFAALNKIETVPYLVRVENELNWNSWKLISKKDEDLTEEELTLLDTIAELSINPNLNFNIIKKLFIEDKRLQPPKDIIER